MAIKTQADDELNAVGPAPKIGLSRLRRSSGDVVLRIACGRNYEIDHVNPLELGGLNELPNL